MNHPGQGPWLALALLLWVPAVFPATVELNVRDEVGGVVAGAELSLQAARPSSFYPGGRPRIPSFGAETDPVGRAVFEKVPAGQYVIRLQGDSQPFVSPERNPFAPPLGVTVAAEDDRISLDLELWRGAEVVCTTQVDRGEIEYSRFVFHELDQGLEVELPLRKRNSGSIRLLPGRWEVGMDPVRGHLLVDVDVNGRSITGNRALLELESLAPATFATWRWHAPAELTGRVGFQGEAFSVAVVARLLEPGPWIDAALQRGGSWFDEVRAGVDTRTGLYDMILPDGLWAVGLEADLLVSSDPESATVTVPPGGSARQDFTAEGESHGTTFLFVRVVGPDGEWVEKATVEVWPPNPVQPREEPIARKKARRAGRATIRGLAPGSYLLAAGSPGYVEGRREIVLDPEDEDTMRATVRLGRGGTLHVIASRGEASEAKILHGVRLHLERVGGDEPDLVLTAPDLVEAMLAPQAETDTTGHAWIHGVFPGRYLLRGEMSGPRGGDSFVWFRDGGQLVAELELDLADGSEREIEAALVPAASLLGRVVCSDDGPMPGMVSVMVVPGDTDIGANEAEWSERALLKQNKLPLAGRPRQLFHAGPLEQGAYRALVRPVGHDRWTWALGTELIDEAATLMATVGQPNELGTIEVDCAPVIRVTPQVATGDALPDLRGAPPEATRMVAQGTVTDDSGRNAKIDGRVEIRRDTVLLRDLPEGVAQIELKLRNGFFIPEPEITIEVNEELQRGRTVDVIAPVADVGGIVNIVWPGAAAARVVGPGELAQTEIASGERIVVSSVPAGSYRLEVCADPACSEVISSRRIEVERLKTVEVRPPVGLTTAKPM